MRGPIRVGQSAAATSLMTSPAIISPTTEGTKEMLALPIPFTAAVMPFSKCSEADGAAVRAAGKEIFIHMPMESLTGKKEWVGDKGIFRSMRDEEIQSRVEEAFTIFPDAKGLNNHMGSAIMEDAAEAYPMEVVYKKIVLGTAKSLISE